MSKPILAILYDFDSTLANSDMQNFGFIPAMGLTPAEFWTQTSEFGNKTHCERTLSYLYTMLACCRERNIKMTAAWLREMGANIQYYPGVEGWFERINKYGDDHGVKVEHYLISSGNKEIVDGCSIAKYFRKMYACEFLFDEKTKEAIWPKQVINYTQKTQYFFRISKGVYDANDDKGINTHVEKRRIPYGNIVYIGDGMTDVPAMLVVKSNGGRSIAVFEKGKEEVVNQLVKDGRVNFACLADYRENKSLDKILKLIIQGVAINEQLGFQEDQTIAKQKASEEQANSASNKEE